MENEMEEINLETTDEFMLVTTQAVSLMQGHIDFFDEIINKSWNPFYKLFLLGKQLRCIGRIISINNLQKLHLREVAKLHGEFAENWRELNENSKRIQKFLEIHSE